MVSINPTVRFVDDKGYLTREGQLLLNALQSGITPGAFQPVNILLTGLSGMGTNTGIVAQTAAATFLKRTLTGSSPILIANGDGVSGDPTFTGDIASDAEVIAGTDTTKIVTPAGFAAGIAAVGGTATTSSLVNYTPTFTGFGTVSNVSIWSRRVGDCLHIRGRFAAGTPTAVQGQMTLGFNGVDGGLTVDATKVTNVHLAGYAIVNAVGASPFCTLIVGGDAYITFGVGTAGSASITQENGNSLLAVNGIMSFEAVVPITGW